MCLIQNSAYRSALLAKTDRFKWSVFACIFLYCGDETVCNLNALQGTSWLQEPLGDIRVLYPKCQTTNEDYLIEKEIKSLIGIYVAGATERARIEAREKYTPEYVKQLRKERE